LVCWLHWIGMSAVSLPNMQKQKRKEHKADHTLNDNLSEVHLLCYLNFLQLTHLSGMPGTVWSVWSLTTTRY
jgi:hypothetical protein